MIYLDSASSHPLLKDVQVALLEHWQEYSGFGENPSARHAVGQKLKAQLDIWQQELTESLGIAPKEWVWLSGATEANNLAIRLAHGFYDKPLKIFLHPFAHPSIVEPAIAQGAEVITLPLTAQGFVDCDISRELVESSLPAALILWPYGDNESGFIDAPVELWQHWHQKGAWIHLDAAQSFGKIPFNIRAFPCQSLTTSGHKFGALAGIGGLYLRLRPKKKCLPLIAGGGQQDNWRSGTLPYSLILSFMTAWRCWETRNLREKLTELSCYFDNKLIKLVGYELLTPPSVTSLPHLRLLRCLSEQVDFGSNSFLAEKIAYSRGSACQSTHNHGSQALLARGFDKKQQDSLIRLSLHPGLTLADLDNTVTLLTQTYQEK